MREIFIREEDNQLSSIEINMEAGEYKSDNPWLFSVFVKYDGINENTEGYEEFLETKESLIIAIEYEEKAKYLGSRVSDGWSEFYFCASNAKELDAMVTAMLKNTGYIYESNIVKDKKWGFYETQLFPTELELAHLQSDKIIFLLEEESEDLTLLRDVEHYASFTTPSQKEKFLDSIDTKEYSFKDEISNDEFENGVALIKNQNVTSEEVRRVVNELYTTIKKHNGYYEGWSTTLVNEELNGDEEE